MDRRIKFRHLEAFVAIARAKRLNRAAEQLNLTQSAISKTLKDLEDILGVTLILRGRAGVSLTDQGEIFLQYAEQSTGALRQGLNSIAKLDAGGAATLRVGVLPSIAASVVPLATERFRAQSPDTELSIQEGAHATLTDRLRAGELDLVVGRLGRPDTMVSLSFSQLYSETVVVVVAPDHPLIHATSLDQLSETLVIYPPKDAAVRPLLARAMIAAGLPLFQNRIESVSAAFGRAMALGPLRAAWFISRGVVAEELAQGTLIALPIDLRSTEGPVGIMARSEERPSAVARLFRQALIEVSAARPAG
ncbi:pca operon transcription factor PcaQ [Flavimaricola marinus]|uniref:Hca operon transcriptional activator n=1 Tax=Flavimaricola marinus TaxID=1819565 RepID=A0A238LKX0_9RHOB|nr:pca operon transcription factor PcaQ [Flavimaricola marinus]SMY10035.1 Hca operon transcriptional activator [Flavimaricola marinus]